MRPLIDWLERMAVALDMKRQNRRLKWLLAALYAGVYLFWLYGEVKWYFAKSFGR